MAYHPNGRLPHGQYNNAQTSATPPSRSGVFAPLPSDQNRYLRREPSFQRGDDARSSDILSEDMIQNEDGTAGYITGRNVGMYNHELFMEPPSPPPPPLPPRSMSYNSDYGGYRHQGSTPVNQPSYNPQQYANTQAQYSPQIERDGSNNYSRGYQPYIPAAYQPVDTQWQASYGVQPADLYQQSYRVPAPAQFPDLSSSLPARPGEQPYGNRRLAQTSVVPVPRYSNGQPEPPYRSTPLPPVPGSAPLPSRPTTYMPPIPPAPPFSPNRDSFPSNATTAITRRPQPHNTASSEYRLPPVQDRVASNHNRLPSLPNQSSNSGSDFSTYLPPMSSLPPHQQSPQRMDTTGRHPQSRPLPGPPPATDMDSEYLDRQNENGLYADTDDEPAYDDLMKEVEAAVMGREPSSRVRRQNPQVDDIIVDTPIDEDQEPQPLFSGDLRSSLGPDNSHTHTNGFVGGFGIGHDINYDAYSDGSDAEAAAGLAAMQLAEEQDAADEARRNSSFGSAPGSQQSPRDSRYDDHSKGRGSDSDVHVDMDSYGGGFSGHVHYNDEALSPYTEEKTYNELEGRSRPLPPIGSPQLPKCQSTGRYDGLYDFTIPNQDYIHPFPTLGARVDTGGTGGLSEPSPYPRRLSFEDGDEATLAESEGPQTSGTQSPLQVPNPEPSLRAGCSPCRPLPAAPVGSYDSKSIPKLLPAGTYQHPDKAQQYDQGRLLYPTTPNAYADILSPSGTPLPLGKSSSLISHSNTPQAVPPIRSKTDAEERRARYLERAQLLGIRTASTSVYGSELFLDTSIPQSAELLALPEIPSAKRRKFNAAKLSTNDFKRCEEPWALSSIVTWIREMSEGESDLREHTIIDGIVALFTHKVPTMNTADAETLGAKLVKSMLESGTLLRDEEWVKFGEQPMSGVLYQLTGSGCYSPRVHTETIPGRCYSHHCMRTLKKVNLQAEVLEPQRKAEDWATFYKVTKEDVENVSKKEVERQNILHEIITTEDEYMDQLYVLRVLFRDELGKWQPPIIAPKRKDKFLQDVFGKLDIIKQVNEDYLLAQMKYRQHEQGPWIIGLSDIFREWIRKAKSAYIEYAASFPNATFLVRQEAERNMLFRQFLEQMRANERSKRLGWDTYLKAPITRLQRYGLLLSTVYKHMDHETEEKTNLQSAIEEIKAVTLECDARVAEMSRNAELSELATKLILRPGMEKVQLNLTHLGREIIFKGDLQRTGSNKFTWLETHAILFDHYFVLAKLISQRDAGGLKYEKYDVSKLPIPMDLLVLESADDDPVSKSKGIGSITTVTTRAVQPTQDNRLGRTISSQSAVAGAGALIHQNTNTSVNSVNTTLSGKTLVTTTVLDSPKDENIMFPFRVKHLGKTEVYTLYAPTAQNRQDWCEKIIEAKTRHAASLYAQNAEPFRLRVIADTAFAYDVMSGSSRSIIIRGTPLDRAIREVESTFIGTSQRPGPVCRASVNCSTAFTQPYGDQKVAVGTDYGVYISDYNNPRGWTRAISANRVTQIAVLEEFSLFLLIADKSLIAYHLDTVCPINGTSTPHSNDPTSRRAPQKLSGARDVGFFAVGRMKDRTLVFYKKREGISSTFKVLEPVYQKSSTSSTLRSMRFGLKKGTTEYFRDFDDFYIPSQTYAINLFHSSLAISTEKGVEVLNLDKKVPLSIPDLKPPDCASIATRIRDLKPLGMFRLSESEFLLVFEEVGIYIDKHGDLSRSVVMEFVGRARQAALFRGTYLVLVDSGGAFVEVRNAVNGRLRQVVSGRDVRLLDDGQGLSREGTVKVCMQHPEWERCQVVVEMIVNEGLKEQ